MSGYLAAIGFAIDSVVLLHLKGYLAAIVIVHVPLSVHQKCGHSGLLCQF